MRKKDLPDIIFFEEKVGSNGIHCLDYENSSNIKYIKEDVVKNISSKLVLAIRTSPFLQSKNYKAMTQILNTENLVEIHEQLNDFAKHHQNKGGQEAHKLVKAIWDESKTNPRDGSPEGLKHDEGFDLAFKTILNHLHRKFVP